MGQKVHPNGMRLGIIREFNTKWFVPDREYADTLAQDLRIRRFLYKKLANAAVSRIVIERPSSNLNVTVYTARPGIVIGKKGEDIEKLRAELTRMNGTPVQLAVDEVRKPELDAKLVAEGIGQQLEKRIMFRRAMKRAVQNSLRLGAKGIKVMVAGRLNGAEIARTEWYREGRVPLHTLRADIDYGTHEAHTTYGVIGIKVWIFKGEINPKLEPPPNALATPLEGVQAEADTADAAATDTPEMPVEAAAEAASETPSKPASKAPSKSASKSKAKAPADAKTKAKPKSKPESKAKPKPKSETKSKTKTEPKSETKSKTKPKTETKAKPKAKPKPKPKADAKAETPADPAPAS